MLELVSTITTTTALTIILALTCVMSTTVAVIAVAPSQQINYVSTGGSGSRCLKDVKVLTPRKFFQLDNDIYNITLESSNRPGHKMVTAAFRIFLEEVLGYDSVSVKTYQDNFNASVVLRRLSGLTGTGSEITNDRAPPETMVNLAVWLPHDIELADWTSPGHVENCGHLGFPGRFGWFIPKSPIVKEHPSVDYWRTYKTSKISSLFSLKGSDLELAEEKSIDPSNGRHYCEQSYCENGVYEPPACKQNDDTRHKKLHSCAVLLASYPDSEIQSSHFLPKQIAQLELHVKIMYLGPNLQDVVHILAEKYQNSTTQSIMFFNWKPSLITTGLDLISISFQACNSDLFCNYESRKLEKIIWAKMKEGARPAYEAVHRISFTQVQYLSLLNLYKKEMIRDSQATVEDIACTWMKAQENRKVWKTWTSSGNSEKTPLYIGGIFPMSGSYTARGIIIAAKMATKAINNDDSVLKDYKLTLHVQNGQCRADTVMKTFIDYIRLPSFPHMAGILGPACSDTVEPLAGVARHFKTVVISYSAEGSTYSDREKYPYFFRTISENKQYQYVYLKLFQTLEWKRVASLTEDGQKYAEYLTHVRDLLKANGIDFFESRKFPRERSANNMSQYLQDLKAAKAKIIIGEFYDHSARAVMCEAFKQKMTAKEGYVWFLPTWFTPLWFDTDTHNQAPGKDPIPCNTSEMIQAIEGHLSLQYAYFAADNDVMQENKTVEGWKKSYDEECTSKNITTSDYGGYAYDAVWTYAYALERLLKQNHSHIANLHSEPTTQTFVRMLNETDFNGVSGHIKFIGGPSRLSVINVVQWINKEKRIVGYFIPTTANNSNEIIGGRLNLHPQSIVWLTPDKTQPDDGTEPPSVCLVETVAWLLNVGCDAAVVISNVTGFGFLGLCLVLGFIFFKRRYDRRVQMTEDYFKALGIDLSATNVSALDKWEMPRDRVVINRKLGEGAFGTVYGGECFFDDRGWVAVAVKTLKVGSSCEQKLDFLSEAEVMKRFEHKNIIKLLGVCTKNEPVYTIMEFMLYGDLKTYLLGRRHLVNERNCEESDEISSKRLTSMTLDVARALSYLAELKYVHRDVACRNCLVNLSRVVKLGDFGMTRPMYENDYYRFNRKGMLPVRWMAPESLALGIFTPMSDVWSFGVLLYEIITFGSFPFQGLSNNQVLEQVKSGATITIPAGVKPQLEGLLRACWALEAQKRPQASEIVEFLANNPRIISPNLDIPLASVQLEGTDQHEIQIPERLRKVTSKSVNKNRAARTISEKEIKENGLNSPEIIPLTPNEKFDNCPPNHQNHNSQQSPYATLQHESDLI